MTQANTLIDQIAALNGQIRAARAMGDNPNTYSDQRDAAVDQLSTLLSTQTSIQANGSALVTVGGRALVNDTQAYHLAAPVIGTDASGNAALVVGMQGDPNPSNPTPVALGSGQLGGYADVYNTKLTSYGQQLDDFASATAAEVGRVTTAGYDQNGHGRHRAVPGRRGQRAGNRFGHHRRGDRAVANRRRPRLDGRRHRSRSR